jgi:hypothetical protein
MSALAATRLRRLRTAGDRGSVSLFFVVATFGLLIAVGLVVDGSGKVRALQRADTVAAEAARAGGEAVLAGPAIRGAGVQVDTAAARSAAAAYLAAAHVAGSVTVAGGTRLQVTTSTSYTPVFLSMIGVGPLTTTGQAEVRLVRGVDGEA